MLYEDDLYLQMADGSVTAKDLWDKPEETFQTSTNAERLLLRQQLNNRGREPKKVISFGDFFGDC